MSRMLWVVFGWFALSVVLVVSSVGKARKPLTGESAAVSGVVVGCLVTLIVLGGHA